MLSAACEPNVMWLPVARLKLPPLPGLMASRAGAAPTLALVAAMLALTLTLRIAFSVSVVFALQLTGALTMMSPGCVSLAVPCAAAIVTLPWFRLFDSVVAPMPDVVSVPLPDETVKSIGSIVQVPCVPAALSVFTPAPAAIRTLAADVSTCPPRPDSACALTVPEKSTLPPCMPPSKLTLPALPLPVASALIVPLLATLSPVIQISPLRSWIVLARTMPLLFTSDAARPWADCAVIVTKPPSAWIRPLLSTEPESPGVTTAEIKPLPLMLTVAARPDASTTWPASTVIVPWLSTCWPNSAR